MMKIKSYILILMLLSLLSCAEEGPFTMGKMECKVEVSMVLPTSAIVSVTIPPGEDNIIGDWDRPSINLSDRPLNSSENFWDVVEFTFMEQYLSEEDHTFNFFVYDLTPNTIYYVVLNAPMNVSDDHDNALYYTTSSFTTAPDGDYSALGEVSVELVEAMEGLVKVKVTLPPALKCKDIDLYASTSSNMSDPITSNSFSYNDGELTFFFSGLKTGRYYFQLKGRFDLIDTETGTTLYPSYSNIYDDFTYTFKNPLTISADQYSQAKCELDFMGDNFTIFCFSLPDNISYSYDGSITWSYGEDVIDLTWDELRYTESTCYVCIPRKFEKGDELKFKLSGRFYLSGNRYEDYSLSFSSEIIVDPSQQLVTKPECVTLFAGRDYTLVETKYPAEFSSLNQLTYAVSENKDFTESINISAYNNFLLLGRDVNHHVDNYVQAKGDFKFNNWNINGGIFDLAGAVTPVTNDECMFKINQKWNLTDLDISIRCAEGFSFTKGSNAILSVYSSLDQSALFSERISDIFSQELEVKIKSQNVSKLQIGERYILRLSDVRLNYNDQQVVSEYKSIDLDWLFPEVISK